jgi:hypothetical protein
MAWPQPGGQGHPASGPLETQALLPQSALVRPLCALQAEADVFDYIARFYNGTR